VRCYSLKKWARAEKEKYVYNRLVAKGIDTKEAQKARGWGYERIKSTYNVDLSQLQENKVDYQLRVDPTRRGVYVKKDAVKVERKTPKVITKRQKIQEEDPGRRRQQRRMILWKGYSEKFEQNMPNRHLQIAQKANLEQGYDINDAYGFAVAYYAFVYNVSPEEVKNATKTSQFFPEAYRTNVKAFA